MKDGKKITDFLRSRVGNFGISSLVLTILEKIMQTDFICPCTPRYNIGLVFCYAAVPFFGCFFFTLYFVDPKPEDCVMENNCCGKIAYSSLIAFIWLFLFFIDGQYVSCACSDWGGEYTETSALKWCKPNGNETVVFERQQRNQKCIVISQFTGFAIAAVIVSILAIIYCCKQCPCCKRCAPGCDYCCNNAQQDETVPLRNWNKGKTVDTQGSDGGEI